MERRSRGKECSQEKHLTFCTLSHNVTYMSFTVIYNVWLQLRERVTVRPLRGANEAVHSGFETQGMSPEV